MTTKAAKLMFARERILSNLKHVIDSIKTYNKETHHLLIACKTRALDSHWSSFQDNILEMEDTVTTVDDKNAYFAMNQLMEDEHIKAKMKIAELLNEDIDVSLDSPLFDINQHKQQPEHKRMHSYRLPEIKITTFSGDYNDWNNFSQLFMKLMSREDLDSIDKIYYLNQSLKGEPLQLIKHLPIDENSFTNAWALLQSQYEVRRHIVHSQFKLFFSIKRMHKESAEDLKRMLQIILECESAFKSLKLDADSLGLMMVYYCVQQMDVETAKQWEMELRDEKDEPKLPVLISFLQTRCRLISQFERNRPSIPATSTQKKESQTKPKSSSAFLSQETKPKTPACPICKDIHRPYECKKLTELSVHDRWNLVKQNRLCYNCLYYHHTKDCTSQVHCNYCNRKHNSMLHTEVSPIEKKEANFTGFAKESRETLLATALIPVYYGNEQKTYIRALIDQGSTSNFISENLCQITSAQKHALNTTITSLNETQTGKVNAFANVTIGSLYDDNYRFTFEALILKKITSVDESKQINENLCQHLKGLKLADPKYFEKGNIDMLIGARVYAEIILSGLRKGQTESPIAQYTKLGWVLSGAFNSKYTHKNVSCNFTVLETNTLSKQLQQFFELEEVNRKIPIRNEDAMCEQKFLNGLHRADDGKFMIELPFKIDPNSPDFLGDSYKSAMVRLFQIEKRLLKDPKLYEMYNGVLQEYIDLGHMREAMPNEASDMKHSYFMPHHAVVKMDRESTKVRVVFDASNKTSNGKSLNDMLMVGPTIQDDLFTIISRWRQYKIAFTGDIEKMYRMVWIKPEHTKYLRILWRKNPSEPIRQYIMKTVTFGTSSAPYQAIRALHQVGNEIENDKPDIARSIKRKFYVDDFLGSTDTVEDAISERKEVSNALKQYGFNLCKWKSNSQEFHQQCSDTSAEKEVEFSDNVCKALGILWLPGTDDFTFRLTLEEIKMPLTKRKLVSEISKLFDPLGWLSPSIVLGKLIIQQLWMEEYDWDDVLPIELQEHWMKMRKLLFECDQIRIPRWIGLTKTAISHSLHGFADASERAFAAVVYLRTVHSDNSVQVELVAAKSKVAPLQKVTLPRLELCGALLLARLLVKINASLDITNIPLHAYSDSMIAIAWINAIPIKWQTFVANRVSEIQELLPATQWKHIVSQLNPADCASRGKFIDELKTFDLWWHGPDFLKAPEDQWPTTDSKKLDIESVPEQRKSTKQKKVFFTHEEKENELLNRFAKIKMLLRVTAYCLRWKNYKRTMNSSAENSVLSVDEIDNALKCWVRYSQKMVFSDEWSQLSKGKAVKANSPILTFTPTFQPNEHLLRASSRLKNANMHTDAICPIILPDKGYFTWLIINDAHERTLHGGCQATLQFIRQRFWILHGRRTVSKQIGKCVTCFRYKMKTQNQLMGDLPTHRVQAAFPFQYTGIDFAGYFEVKSSRIKNARFMKCYVSLFVCMTTKAIHLELVRDLSTEAFLDAFRCFTARRGIPKEIFTDRGTNFIGASKEMPNLLTDLKNQQTQLVVNELLNDHIKWHFIPAHAPHFGGLWEAGVKSMKYHLKRVLHQTKLTEQQFHTVLAQIEACLNSRPLCQLNENADDLEVLTPGHFLIGRALNTLPEPSYLQIMENRLKAYQYIQRLVQEFWKKWHAEYLHTLQGRSKWNRQEDNLTENQIVLLKEDNLPPSQWLIGKIHKVTYGTDGLVRAVEVQCKSNIVTRAIHKLCLLPTDDNIDLFKLKLKSGQYVGTTCSNNRSAE